MTNKEKYEARKAYNDKRNAESKERTARVNQRIEDMKQANRSTGKVIDKNHPLAPTYELEVIPDIKPIYKEKDYTPRRRITHG